MSYDIRFGVKGEPDGRMYVVFEPEISHPTYNLGDMFRAAMDWNYEQGEWYKVSDILPNIHRGLKELSENRNAYRKYEPNNGWGTINGAESCLRNILETIQRYIEGYDWNDYELEYLYMRW